MPLDYLRSIRNAAFPLTVEDPQEVNCVAVLLAAKLVEGSISVQSNRAAPQADEIAVIERITLLGHVELARKGGGPPSA